MSSTEIKETAVAVTKEYKVASTPEEYKAQAEAMLARFLEELKNTDNTWEPVFTTPQIQAWKKINEESGVYQLKFIAMIPFPQATLEKILFDITTRKTWDSMISEIKPIETYNDQESLLHFEAPGLFGFGARDLLHYRLQKDLPEDNANLVIDISVANDKVPESKNYVRGHTVLSAGKIQPTKYLNKETKKLEDASLYSCISELDVKGYVPKSVINIFGPGQTQKWFDELVTACDREAKGKSVAPKGFLSGWF